MIILNLLLLDARVCARARPQKISSTKYISEGTVVKLSILSTKIVHGFLCLILVDGYKSRSAAASFCKGELTGGGSVAVGVGLSDI